MSEDWELKICCMGAGYVGGPTMAVIAKQCPKVRKHRENPTRDIVPTATNDCATNKHTEQNYTR